MNSIGPRNAITEKKNDKPCCDDETWRQRDIQTWSDGSDLSEEQVILRFTGWMNSIIHKQTARLPSRIYKRYREEMGQEVRVALLLRWRRYQKEKIEIPFVTYAWSAVRGAVVSTYRDRRPDTVNTVSVIYADPIQIDAIIDERTLNIHNCQVALLEFTLDLAQAAKGLALWERNLLTLRYFEDMNLKEIGQLAGVTESRVCQIHGHVLDKVRRLMEVA